MPTLRKVEKILLWIIAIGTGVAFCVSLLFNWFKTTFDAKTAAIEITVHNPPANFQMFDPTSLRILAFGCFVFLSCWGISKVLKVWK
jgi:hypothetical protein